MAAKIISLAEARGQYYRGFSAGYNRHQLTKPATTPDAYAYLSGYTKGTHLRSMDDMLWALGDAFCSTAAERSQLFELRATIAQLRERSALQGRRGEITEEEELEATKNFAALRGAVNDRNTGTRVIELSISDTEIGCSEYGTIMRDPDADEDDEDARYATFLLRTHPELTGKVHVANGRIYFKRDKS